MTPRCETVPLDAVTTTPSISFLTDFGLRDGFVGVCHGVIATIAPTARVIDVTHEIPPQAIQQGALVLAATSEYMPPGVHLAVVDPEVGGERRAVALSTRDGRTFVGPDNGLLTLAADARGIAAAHELANAAYRLPQVSRTFHARDVFAPAAAHLANGVPIGDLGPALEPETLVRLTVPEPEVGRTQIGATVLDVDRFGNVQLNVRRAHVDAFGLDHGDRVELRLALDRYYATVASTFADAGSGALLLYEDSYGAWSIAIASGDAARLTGAHPGDELRIARA